MPYKDPEKQKKAMRDANKRKRQANKKVNQPVNPVTLNPDVNPEGYQTPEGIKQAVPKSYGTKQCQCMHCKQTRRRARPRIINHWARKTATELHNNEVNRVCLPGDVDYTDHNTIEQCSKCGGELMRLAQPRTKPGMCYQCVMAKQDETGLNPSMTKAENVHVHEVDKSVSSIGTGATRTP